MNLWWAIAIFIAAFVVDIVWVFYIRGIARLKTLVAASWAAVLALIGCFMVVSYVENPFYIIPVALGAFFGTYLAIWYERGKYG
jgi:hypothetical protein